MIGAAAKEDKQAEAAERAASAPGLSVCAGFGVAKIAAEICERAAAASGSVGGGVVEAVQSGQETRTVVVVGARGTVRKGLVD